MEEKLNNFIDDTNKRFERVEGDVSVLKTDVKEIKERLGKVENDVCFLRDEVRIGFNTLNDTLNSMFDLTAKSIRANKKVAVIMENAYSEATEEYTRIKKSKK